MGSWGLSNEYKFKIVFTDFCSGVCRNLSMDVFSEVALKNVVEISNFSTEDQKKVLTC